MHLVPDAFRVTRVFADDVAAQFLDIADARFGREAAGGFAEADDALVGVELDEDPILPGVADDEGLEIGDTHGSPPYMLLRCA